VSFAFWSASARASLRKTLTGMVYPLKGGWESPHLQQVGSLPSFFPPRELAHSFCPLFGQNTFSIIGKPPWDTKKARRMVFSEAPLAGQKNCTYLIMDSPLGSEQTDESDVSFA